jgi:hypothetical protein
MPRPSDDYYRSLRSRIGDVLAAEQYRQVEELGILVDRDDQVRRREGEGGDTGSAARPPGEGSLEGG